MRVAVYGPKSWAFVDTMKDLEVERTSWVIWVSPKYNHMCDSGEAEGDLPTDKREDSVATRQTLE